MTSEKTLHEEVSEFVSKLPMWQIHLLAQVVDGTEDNARCAATAHGNLLNEAGLTSGSAPLATIPFPNVLGASASANSFKDLRLLAIKDFENINAIRPGQTLTFGPQLTVIYGGNGSGKSGFVRLFSNVFYSRGDRTILGNIFAPKAGTQPSAKFSFQTEGSTPYEINFDAAKTSAEFGQFAVFDSKSVQVHVNDGNELYVSPRVLNDFERFAICTSNVGAFLDRSIAERDKPNELLLLFPGDTAIRAGIQNLNGKSDLTRVRAASMLSEEEKNKQSDLEQELSKLKFQDIDKRKAEFVKTQAALASLKVQLDVINRHFIRQPLTRYEEALAKHLELQAAVEKTGVSQFTNSSINGVGSPLWKSFLVSAHAFAIEQKQPYPATDSACILCHQNLTSQAVSLVEKYWTFLKGEEEKSLRASEEDLKKLMEELTRLNFFQPVPESDFVRWLGINASEFLGKVSDFLKCSEADSNSISKCLSSLKWADLDSSSSRFELSEFEAVEKKLRDEVEQLNVSAISERCKKIEFDLLTFQHRQALVENYDRIEAFVRNAAWVETAKEWRKKINTKPITDLQKKVHEELLNKKYIQLFHQECVALRAPFQISLEQKGSLGKTKRHLFVEGLQSGKILSEGEQRAIALADFFTEVEMSGINSGLILDDPVNSLDHVRRTTIAVRLVEAAKKRQVVIFTHDLSFLCDLRNSAGDRGVSLTGHWVEKHEGMENFESGVIHLDCPPISESDYADPTEAEDCLKEAKEASNPREKNRRIKDGMSSLRASYEAFILLDLFAGTVTRFDKEVKHTKFENTYVPREYVDLVSGKLKHLSGYIDGHLHADRTAGAQPSVDHLATEIKEYQEMKGRFKAERRTALNLS